MWRKLNFLKKKYFFDSCDEVLIKKRLDVILPLWIVG